MYVKKLISSFKTVKITIDYTMTSPWIQPARTRGEVVSKVLADTGQVVLYRYAQVHQAFGLADAGEFEQLRGVDRAGADDEV